jgi:hypothetical protein
VAGKIRENASGLSRRKLLDGIARMRETKTAKQFQSPERTARVIPGWIAGDHRCLSILSSATGRETTDARIMETARYDEVVRNTYLVSILQHFVLIFLLALSADFVSGCQMGNPGTPGMLGIPPENHAKILSRLIGKTDTQIHWKWSLIGERTWMVATNRDGVVGLEKTVPLNDPGMKGGTNIYETDLTVTQSAANLNWKARIHGSNGATADSEGSLPGKLSDVQVVFDRDNTVNLPADVTLARLGSRTISWRLAR